MSTAETPTAETPTAETPAADGLLLLHGFTGRGGSWREVLATCAVDAPAWCPDLLGHGPKAPGARIATFDGEVDRLAAGLVRRGISRALVVGYSMGARVGLGLLVRHGGLVAGAVLVGARPGLGSAEDRRARREKDRVLAETLIRDGVEAFIDRWQALPLFATQRDVAPERLARHRRRRLSHTATGLAHALETLGLGNMPDVTLPDVTPALASIDVPVRLMAGALDSVFVAAAEDLARWLPRATLTVVPGAGHDLILETPRAVGAAIEEEWKQCLM